MNSDQCSVESFEDTETKKENYLEKKKAYIACVTISLEHNSRSGVIELNGLCAVRMQGDDDHKIHNCNVHVFNWIVECRV